ncbi:MAG: endospore germination permease [Carboxydocellales bacterium]
MLEKGKLTSIQLFCLVTSFMFGSTVILQNLTAAGRDTWISTILAIACGVIMVIITTQLALSFPGLTLIEYIELLFGKILGKLIGALYLWYFMHLGALVLRNYGDLMSITVMQETPIWFFHLTLALIVAFFVYKRIEVMGRVSELLLPLTLLISIITSIFINLSGVMLTKNLKPVLEHGLTDILKGSFSIASFPYQESILFAMIYPYVNIPTKTRKSVIAAILFSGLILLSILIQDIGIFGEQMVSLTFPRYTAVKMISVGNFVERIDPFILAIWIMSGIIKIGVCLYCFVLGLAQLLKLKDYQALIIPSALIMIVLSNLIYDNTLEMLDFAVNIYPVYVFPFQVGLPLIMLVLSWFRKPGLTAK